MQRKKQVRFAVQTIDAELAQLAQLPAGTIPPSLITELFESWGELVGLLSLGPGLEPWPCPRCGHTVALEAQRCGHCWATLGSHVASDA
jgi:hypothetical protein